MHYTIHAGYSAKNNAVAPIFKEAGGTEGGGFCVYWRKEGERRKASGKLPERYFLKSTARLSSVTGVRVHHLSAVSGVLTPVSKSELLIGRRGWF